MLGRPNIAKKPNREPNRQSPVAPFIPNPLKESVQWFFRIAYQKSHFWSYTLYNLTLCHMKALPRSTAKDVFAHLFAIVTLYVSVVSFIILGFQYVDVTFPDTLTFYYSGILDAIRGSMASLIVMWPAFMGISWYMNKEAKADPEKREISIRKWLLYLTLFITAITIIVDLITLMNYFLNGAITMHFLLKVLIVLATASVVFGYYMWDLRTESITKSKVPKKVAFVTSLVVLATIVLGFVLVGSPMQQRKVRFDDTRVQDLSMIQSQITNYYQLKQALPSALSDLENPLMGFSVPVDPNTGAAFEYTVISPLSFELCATFEAASAGGASDSTRPYGVYAPYNESWTHDDQRTCFTRTIDPAMYPPVTGTPYPMK